MKRRSFIQGAGAAVVLGAVPLAATTPRRPTVDVAQFHVVFENLQFRVFTEQVDFLMGHAASMADKHFGVERGTYSRDQFEWTPDDRVVEDYGPHGEASRRGVASLVGQAAVL